MNLAVITLNPGVEFNPEQFESANLPALGVAGGGSHFLVRIDDESRTADGIKEGSDFIHTIEMITGNQKAELLKTYNAHGAVTIAVNA